MDHHVEQHNNLRNQDFTVGLAEPPLHPHVLEAWDRDQAADGVEVAVAAHEADVPSRYIHGVLVSFFGWVY